MCPLYCVSRNPGAGTKYIVLSWNRLSLYWAFTYSVIPFGYRVYFSYSMWIQSPFVLYTQRIRAPDMRTYLWRVWATIHITQYARIHITRTTITSCLCGHMVSVVDSYMYTIHFITTRLVRYLGKVNGSSPYSHAAGKTKERRATFVWAIRN